MDKVGIIFGGKSAEYEISLMSAAAVLRAIDQEKHQITTIGITKDGKWFVTEPDPEKIEHDEWREGARPIGYEELPSTIDFALIIMHGNYGEDGRIQGVFEFLDIPYSGSGVLGTSITMDKIESKMALEANRIPTPKYAWINVDEYDAKKERFMDTCEHDLGYPMFVKPSNTGSSIGICKVRTRQELEQGLQEAMQYDRRIIVEQGIDARELETGVIGNGEPLAATVGEIKPAKDFYDYEAKYSDDAGTVIDVPADISKEIRDTIRKLAVDAYLTLDCTGFARVDFLMDNKSGEIFVNEINSIPGMTKYSMFPMLWSECGYSFRDILEKIIRYGYERKESAH